MNIMGNCTGMTAKSMIDLGILCTKYGIETKFYFLFNESLVQRSRNYIADEFLRSNCTHLMFIDADIGFNPNHVLSLLAIQVSDPEKYSVMTAPYPKKTIAWEKVKKAVESGKVETNPFDLQFYAADYVFNPIMSEGVTTVRLDEPAEVAEAGTGFMLIPRNVFEQYEKAYPQYKYKPDHVRTESFDGSREIMAYFDCAIDPESRRYLSEDYFFCYNVRKIGLKVHMCLWMDLQHIGSYIFRGSMNAIAALGASPTVSEESTQKFYKKQQEQPKKKKMFRS
jgi:hypothetical protein